MSQTHKILFSFHLPVSAATYCLSARLNTICREVVVCFLELKTTSKHFFFKCYSEITLRKQTINFYYFLTFFSKCRDILCALPKHKHIRDLLIRYKETCAKYTELSAQYKIGNLPYNMVDDDGVGGQEEVGEALRDLRKLQPRAVKNLQSGGEKIHFDAKYIF